MTSIATQRRCFCGQFTPDNDSLYCSPRCAHQDALDSLTLGIPHPSSSTFAPLPTLPKGFFSDLPKKHGKPVSTLDEDDALYGAGMLSPDFGPFAASKRPIPHSRIQKSTMMASGDPPRSSHHRQRRSVTSKAKRARHSSTNDPPSVPRSITTSVASSTRDDRGSRSEWKSHYQRVQSKRTSKGHATMASDDIPVFLVQLLKDVEEMRAREETAEQEMHKEMQKSANGLIKPPTVNYRMGSFGPVAEGSLPSGMLDSCMTTPRAAVEVPAQDSPIEHCDPREEFTYRATQRQLDRCNSVSSHTSGSLMTSAAPDSDAPSRSSWISRTTGSSQAGDSPVKPIYPNHPTRAGEASLRDARSPALSVPERRCKYGSAFGVHEVDMEEPVAATTVTIASRNEGPPTAKPSVPAPLPNVNMAPAYPTPPPVVPSALAFKLSSTMEESRLFHRRLESRESRSKSQSRAGSQTTCEEQTPLELVPSATEIEQAQEPVEASQSGAQEKARPSYLVPHAKRELAASGGGQKTAVELLSQHSSPFVTPPRKKSAPASLLRSQWSQFGLSTTPPPRPPTGSPGTTSSRESPLGATNGSPADSRSRHLPGTVVRKTVMGSKARLPIGGTVGIAAPVARSAVTTLSSGNIASLFARPKSPSNNLAVGRPKTPSNAPRKVEMPLNGAEEPAESVVEDVGLSAGGRARGPSVTTLLPQAGSLTNSTTAAQTSSRTSAVTLSFAPRTSAVTASNAFSMSLQANAFSSLGSSLGASNTFRAPAYAMSPPKIQQSTRMLHMSASTSSLRSSRSKALEGREGVVNRHRRIPSVGDESVDEQRTEGGGFKTLDHHKAAALSVDDVSETAMAVTVVADSERECLVDVRQPDPSTSAKTGSAFQLHGAPNSRSLFLQSDSDVQSTAGSDYQSQTGSESLQPETPTRAQNSTRELALSAKTRERLAAARQRVAELRQAKESGLSSSRDSVSNGRLSIRDDTPKRSLSPRPSPLSSPLSARGSVPNSPSSIEPPTPRAASPSMSSEQSLSPCTSEAPTTPRDGERMFHIASPRDNLVSLVKAMGHVPSILISPSNVDALDTSGKVALVTRTKRSSSNTSNTTDISCGTDHSFVDGRSIMCVAEKMVLSTSTPSTAVRTTFAWDTMPQ